MMKKSQHVVPRGDRWAIHSTGAQRMAGVYLTQEEAITIARSRARAQGTELYIHGRDGRIRERNSYGHDPLPPKG